MSNGNEIISDIKGGIADLLEGKSGYNEGNPNCDRYIPRGRFRHVKTEIDRAGPEGGAEPRFPFTVRTDGYAGATDTPADATGGTYLYGRYRLTIEVGYGNRPQKEDELDSQIASDTLTIIDVLVAEQNWVGVDGWSGCEVMSSFMREGGEGDPPPMVISTIDIEVVYRQKRGPYL